MCPIEQSNGCTQTVGGACVIGWVTLIPRGSAILSHVYLQFPRLRIHKYNLGPPNINAQVILPTHMCRKNEDC